jgi:hypothetical protein
VIATDVNPRALVLTGRNAEGNGLHNIRCMMGRLTEPVTFERFGLVVGNLPFVMSPPDSGLTFRDGEQSEGSPYSSICADAVMNVGGVLEPGGYAQFLVNWVITDEGGIFDEPVGWIKTTGLDALILLHSRQTPDEYVQHWATWHGDDSAQWLTHLESLRAVAVANGAVIVRAHNDGDDEMDGKRKHHGGPPIIRTARMTTSPRGTGGEQIERIVGSSRPSDADILTGRPAIVCPHVWTDVNGSGEHTENRRRLIAQDTCGITATVAQPFDQIVEDLDGETSLDEAVRNWARRHGVDDRRSVQQIGEAMTEIVRRLIVIGLVTISR